jgi:hypothetical protein
VTFPWYEQFEVPFLSRLLYLARLFSLVPGRIILNRIPVFSLTEIYCTWESVSMWHSVPFISSTRKVLTALQLTNLPLSIRARRIQRVVFRSISTTSTALKMSRKLCMIPGPVEFQEEVLVQMSTPATSHLDPTFMDEFGSCLDMLREVFSCQVYKNTFIFPNRESS